VTGAVTLTNRPALPPFRKMSTFESKPSHDDLNLYADLDTSHPGTIGRKDGEQYDLLIRPFPFRW